MEEDDVNCCENRNGVENGGDDDDEPQNEKRF